MSKIMSVFEKLNLVEKANNKEIVGNSDKEDVNLKNNDDETKVKNEADNTKKRENEIKEDKPLYSQNSGTDIKIVNKIDSSKENNLTIEEIYSSYGIENSNVNTIFMLGNFINALPESLPHKVKKESIINIINSSNIDLDKLISDGRERLNILKQFSKEHCDSINGIIQNYKDEIEHLTKLVDDYRKQIQINENLLNEQDNIVEYETRKINNIISFFGNDD
ncbi:MAG: hypothetical protein LKE46_07530 [Clostridium sp.]|jgi:hypothetical protein|uniref:hypothetical protein n=1 Tax=Clostridium sp. TaxID=1506 RepID=UPI0025B7CC3A|nr:hypothetical protein [Clostridium sp.]MCH3964113.1 hypothetical protein [Clostridium sp.]MCI1716314.1 hypothetical protein [Clostridium sp.]MCI1800446.1 hypothetical protein [Clostridium sp.]MCI1814491.1 hypothetical protein [Clostridium sp.]MCI1871390.1 hypothetical protein [Clostridium sp.]